MVRALTPCTFVVRPGGPSGKRLRPDPGNYAVCEGDARIGTALAFTLYNTGCRHRDSRTECNGVSRSSLG